MVVATAVLFPIGLLASARGIEHRVKAYTFWFLLLESAIMGIFLSLDLVAFFVFWEAMLVPMYFLIAGWGSANRRYAAMKFFIYTAAGSAFLLAALLVLGVPPPGRHRRAHLRLPGARRRGAGSRSRPNAGCSSGSWSRSRSRRRSCPFHTWLPDVHTEAPTAGSVVLAGVILKMGAYGVLRFGVRALPAGRRSTSRRCSSRSR